MAEPQIDVVKVARYPPEAFVAAAPLDLGAGENAVARYSNFGPWYISLRGVSMARLDGGAFSVDADGKAAVFRMSDMGAARGIDYNEDVKVPATETMTLRIYAPSATSAFQFRHSLAVLRPTVALKLLLGAELKEDERELARAYGLDKLVALGRVAPLDLRAGVEKVFTETHVLTASGEVLRYAVPDGYKAVLLGISADRPGSAASAYLSVARDRLEVMNVDLYCLQSPQYDFPVRVVALEELRVKLDVKAAGTYRVRVAYGLGRVTIPEKVAWGLPLTPQEERVAAEEDLRRKVQAGIE